MDTPGNRALLARMLERMRMYQAAVALNEEIEKLLDRAREKAPKIADHLERSANSVLFNTAEGIGSFQPKVKISAYDIARKEASEVRAALRRLVIKRVFTRSEVRKADNLATVCIRMLTNANIALERQLH
jgi:four helix bundle protein